MYIIVRVMLEFINYMHIIVYSILQTSLLKSTWKQLFLSVYSTMLIMLGLA